MWVEYMTKKNFIDTVEFNICFGFSYSKVLDVELHVLYSLEVCMHCFTENEIYTKSYRVLPYLKTIQESSLLRIINHNFFFFILVELICFCVQTRALSKFKFSNGITINDDFSVLSLLFWVQSKVAQWLQTPSVQPVGFKCQQTTWVLYGA